MAIELETLPAIGERNAAQILELLARPFRPEVIRSRKIAGRDVRYLPVGAVTERLNRACNSWSFLIAGHETRTMRLNRWNDQTKRSEPRDVDVFVAICELEIPELGTRQAIGVQAIDALDLLATEVGPGLGWSPAT